MTPSNTIKRLEMYVKYWEKTIDVQKSLSRLKHQSTEVSQVIERMPQEEIYKISFQNLLISKGLIGKTIYRCNE